jgi:Ca-activated chloride channel family protein
MIILAWPWALAALPLPLLARFLPAVGPGRERPCACHRCRPPAPWIWPARPATGGSG